MTSGLYQHFVQNEGHDGNDRHRRDRLEENKGISFYTAKTTHRVSFEYMMMKRSSLLLKGREKDTTLLRFGKPHLQRARSSRIFALSSKGLRTFVVASI